VTQRLDRDGGTSGDPVAPPRALALRRQAFAAALSSGDASLAAHAYAEGAILFPPAADLVEGRKAIESFWNAGLHAGMTEVELRPLRFEQREAIAYELGRYRVLVEGEQGSVVDEGTYTVIHERQPDGSWLRAAEMFSPARAAPGRG
jgi:ketosteroid isomerase-like protein